MLVCSQWLQIRREMASVDEDNIENQARGEPCGGLRKELKECLLASDCVKLVRCVWCCVFEKHKLSNPEETQIWEGENESHGLKPSSCLDANAAGVDEECRKVQYAFFECKRSLLDFRTRFRGRKGY